MTNNPDVQTIRQALAEATQGQWLTGVSSAKADLTRAQYHHMVTLPTSTLVIAYTGPYGEKESKANAYLIANAPEWLRWAVDEIETLKGLHQRTSDQLDAESKTSAYLRQELDLMRQVANANADKAIEASARSDGLRAQLDAKDTEIAAARAEADEQRLLKIKYNTDREKMRIFLRDCIRQVCWGDMDGGDLQEKAEAFGFLRPEPYDPDKHGEIDAEAGDTIYAFAGPLEGSS